MNLKKIYKLVRKHYIILLFILTIAIVVVASLIKVFSPKPTYIYARVKLGQGLWWASTGKPNVWFMQALKKGEKEYNLLGVPTSEILEVRYYPYKSQSTDDTLYNIYLTIKLATNVSKKTNKYSYKRYPVLVGAPIEFEFPSAQVTGTVIEMTEEPPQDKYLEKTVTLSKKFAFPWEYDAIKIGDKFFDGEEVVFEVLNKNQAGTSIITSDLYGNITASTTDLTKYIIVEARIKAKSKGGLLIFGEEQVLIPGSPLDISTSNYNFNDFTVGMIE